MPRKKVDERVRTLLENGVKLRQRTLIAIVGDHGKDQVVNLHYILSKAQVKARPSVLWCYKKELGFSTHKKKRMRQIKKMVQRGLHDPDKDDPFELFVTSTNIRWCYYKDSHKVLGQTYGMCVLQDFEALTPNILARTIETVEGGGVIVLLFRTMDSLKQLYTMSMDVHARFRTEAHQDVVARFNERFLLSLSSCQHSMVLDDELNVLPISSHARNIKPVVAKVQEKEDGKCLTAEEAQLVELRESLADTQPAGALVSLARTVDQAKAILTFVEAISEKTLRSTVALTAARGRGKSAALGVSLAGAVAFGYSNIFVTAPSPENLKTVFEFVFKGFDALQYKEHLDYEIIQSTNPDFNKAVVRVNIFREHRQTIQYIQPQDCEKLSQAELVVVDEAAAIPLPLVNKLLGPYLVFLSSTVNGYEGTGRSLSLKLVAKLREAQSASAKAAIHAASAQVHGNKGGVRKGERKVHEERWQTASSAAASATSGVTGRILREVSLECPIRYASGDPIEQWLNKLLCLDAANGSHRLVSGTPHPKDCELYYVDRDALFSYHKLSEAFLQRLVSLFVASHYKNQPNDLQLMSDAPAHQVYVLLGPQAESQGNAGGLPDVLCAVQVCLEGQISRESLNAELSRGKRASGDLIPWTLSQQFQDQDFAQLSGARVVRVATHPDVQSMGYGTRAIELLSKYFQGDIIAVDEVDTTESEDDETDGPVEDDKISKSLLKEDIKPKKKLPPLLLPLSERKPERLHWFGVSFGLTNQLYNFWRRVMFSPVYVRQTPSDLTGEHTTIMFKALNCRDLPDAPAAGWEGSFIADARRRFLSLLSYEFRKMPVSMALGLVEDKQDDTEQKSDGQKERGLTVPELRLFLTRHDMARLESYARNMVDYHMIMDLLPSIAKLHFLGKFGSVTLSHLQKGILLGLGLQHKDVDQLGQEFALPTNQLLALFNKSMRKFSLYLKELMEDEANQELSSVWKKASHMEKAVEKMVPTTATLKEEMESGAAMAEKSMKKKQKQLLESLDVMQYAVQGSEADWEKAAERGVAPGKLIQMKSQKTPTQATDKSAKADKKKRSGSGGKRKGPQKKQKHKH